MFARLEKIPTFNGIVGKESLSFTSTSEEKVIVMAFPKDLTRQGESL